MQSRAALNRHISRHRRALAAFAAFVASLAIATAGAQAAGASAAPPTIERTTGLPTSANGASTLALDPLNTLAVRRASVVLEIMKAPAVPSLYFWAMQVDFASSDSRSLGGAHVGLQWNPAYPKSNAVNFGGYDNAGTQLAGDVSPLPSSMQNVNTRDFAWKAGVKYELRVVAERAGWWRADITDLGTGAITLIRRLYVGVGTIAHLSVWSEVFAACDAPTTSVRWSKLAPEPAKMRVSYQSVNEGGCTNTTSERTSRGLVQRTTATRTLPQDTTLRRYEGWNTR
jgi:hypothetical protein